MEKNELIADLYGLRAGLSKISEENDIVISCDNNLSNNDKIMANAQNKISQSKKEILGLQCSIETENQQCATLAKFNEDEKNKKIKEKKKDTWLGALVCLIIPIFLTIGVLEIIFASQGDYEDLLLLLLPIVAWTAWGLIVSCIVKKQKRKISAKYDKEKSEFIHESNSRIKKLKKQIAINNNQIAQAQETINVCLKNTEKYKTDYDQQAVPAIVRANEMQNCLESTYNSVILPSDWKNIDMLIFYLTTGRADNMKEALLLYDRQKQTDEIVGAINQAESTIRTEIRGGLQALGQAMIKCFERLSDQLAVQHAETMSTLGSINRSLQENTLAIAALGTAQIASNADLQHSLTTKIDCSSQKLVADMESLKKKFTQLGLS